MKKLLVILLSLTIFIVSTGLVSCGKEESAIKDLGNGLYEKLMVDFESTEEIMSVKLTAHEATIERNTDKDYISRGKSSMKMHLNQSKGVIGYYQDTILQFIPGNQYFSQTDYSKVVGICADIWNANDFDIEMCFSINNKAYVIEYLTLKPGYNKIEFNFDNNQIISITDKQLLSLDFSFYSENGNEILYIDNVRLKTTDAEYKPYDFSSVYKDNIVFGFENFAERTIIIDLGGYDSLFSRARASINTERKYITQGNGSLKVDFYKSPKTGKVDNKKIRTYDKILPDFNQYANPNNSIEKWSLVCDIYNATNKKINVNFLIFSIIDDETYTVSKVIDVNKWGKLEMAMEDVKQAFTNKQIKALTVVFDFDNIDIGDTVYIDNLHFEKE